MDYRNANRVSWQWQGDDYLHQKDVDFDLSQCEWNRITQNEPDVSYMFEQRTPVKACGDTPYHFNNDCDVMTKTPQKSEDSSPPLKRRRVLDFDDVNDDILFSSLKSKGRIDAFDDFLSEISRWEECLQDLSPSSFEDLSQSEAWLAECLDVTNVNISPDNGTSHITYDAQIGKTEVSSNALDSAPNMAQQAVRSSRNVIFRGRRAYMKAPPKQGSSIAYPFEFIKPCSARGDVTLKDINHQICTPPPSKAKQIMEDPPISAISGKPIVGKTRIPTQGGRGSITIMRTIG